MVRDTVLVAPTTLLPPASSTVTVGWVVQATALAPPPGWVVNASVAAGPTVMLNVELVAVSVPPDSTSFAVSV